MQRSKAKRLALPINLSLQFKAWMLSGLIVTMAMPWATAHAQTQPGHAPAHHMMAPFGGLPMGPGLEMMLSSVNATSAQREQIKQIIAAAQADTKPAREAMHSLRAQGLQIFTAPTIDASAAESLRQQMNAQQERVSQRSLKAMLDVANVLSPEQRAKLGQLMQQHMGMHGHHRMKPLDANGPAGAGSQPMPADR